MRGGFAASLTGVRLDRVSTSPFSEPVLIRTDVRVPVLMVQSETDLMILGSAAARQPDSTHIRLWEIAGASHADTYLTRAAYQDSEDVDPAMLAAALAPTDNFFGIPLTGPMNSGPQQHYVASSALEHLIRWIEDGKEPPQAPRLEIASLSARTFTLDRLGIAQGGVRSPWVDVPTAVLSGMGQTSVGFAPLFGTTTPFDARRLEQLYPRGRGEYLARFAAATEQSTPVSSLQWTSARSMRWPRRRTRRRSDASIGLLLSRRLQHSLRSTRSEPFSPIMRLAALVFALTSRGMMDASMTRTPVTPRTRSSGSTTESGSEPMRHVPTA